MVSTFNPAGTSPAHDIMTRRVRELRCVFGGTETLKKAGRLYLPQFERESDPDWQARMDGNRLRSNMFRKAVERTTGRIFEVPTRLDKAAGEGQPDPGTPAWTLWDNADNRGSSLDRVARQMVVGALSCGLSHVLVDYPIGQYSNLAEERRAAPRPYLVRLDPDQVLEAYEDDQGAIIYLRWFEQVITWDAAQSVPVATQRIQERLPGQYVVWEQTAEVSSLGALGRLRQSWHVTAQGTIAGTNKIMLHTLYAEREDFLVGRTPLTEVADLTLLHWEVGSDYKNCLQRVLFPVLYATGMETKELGTVGIGPKSILGSTSKDAKFGYVEHTGAALKSGREFLLDLEQSAQAYAGQLTQPSGDVKATQSALSTAEASSWAKDFAISAQDTLQAAIDDCVIWQPEIGAPRVVVNLDFAVDLPEGDLTELGSMRRAGDLPRRDYWSEMQRRNVLRSDFDMDKAEADLEDEQADAMQRETDMMQATADIAAPREPAEGEE